MSLDVDTLFKQLRDISSGTHVQLRTSTPTGRMSEMDYPTIPVLPPCAGPTTLTILKGREPGHSEYTYVPVSGAKECVRCSFGWRHSPF